MGAFNNYAKKLDEIAQKAFSEYREAEAAYRKAEEKAKAYPPQSGITTTDYAAKAARAQADFLEAKAAYENSRRHFGEAEAVTIKELRHELETAVNDAYSADPTKLDSNTLELLKSGILNSREYARLMTAAQAASNPTMVRIIGKYAQDAADAMGAKYGQNDQKTRDLYNVAYQSRAYTGSTYLDNFDVVTDVFNRCTRNPALIDKWDALTGEIINQF